MANKNPIDLTPINKEYSEFSKACKKMALARRANSPVQVEKTPEVLKNIQEYIEQQRRNNKPLTHAGFMRCFGLNSKTYYSLDLYDHIIDEYRVLHNLPEDAQEHITDDGVIIPLIAWSAIKEKICDNAIQEQLEENCYTNKGNPAGSIFGLKARYDWKEDNTPQHLTQNLVIADSEQARKALAMLTNPD